MIQQQFGRMPDIVKNLLILNALAFLATLTLGKDVVYHYGAQHYLQHPNFQPFQLVTAIFLHGGLWHILFNMLLLFFFGSDVERILGPGRFLMLYLIAGFGANLLELGFDYVVAQELMSGLNPQQIAMARGDVGAYNEDLVNEATLQLAKIWYTRSIGASGAVYGVLFAFAAIDPNRVINLLIPPISVKAVYVVLFLALMEFLRQTNDTGSNIGHFVHLAGGAIGLILVAIWRRGSSSF